MKAREKRQSLQGTAAATATTAAHVLLQQQQLVKTDSDPNWPPADLVSTTVILVVLL